MIKDLNMQENKTLKIRPASPADNKWLEELMDRYWNRCIRSIKASRKR